MSNLVSKHYLDESTHTSDLRRATQGLKLPEVFANSYGKLQLDRPLFVPEGEIVEFAADLTEIFALLVSLPARLYDGDLRRYCAKLGMDNQIAELMCLGATGTPPLYARADAYHDGTSFKPLEFNVGSELGGIDIAVLNRAFLAVPTFADFAARHKLSHIDTMARTVATLRKAAESEHPVVGLIESTGGIAAHEHVFVALQEAMREEGITLLLGEIHQLDQRDGKITLGSTPLDIVLRYFVAGELVDDPTGRQQLELLIRAHKTGKTVLFTPLEGAAFASKGSLAMLHDPAVRVTFSEQERAVVDRVVPWTRLLGVRDGQDELFARCRADREDLVLKPGVGYGGVGTVVGHTVTDEQWEQALLECRTGDHVVQRRVRPRAEPVLNADTGIVEDWVANWGIFVDSAGYAGGFVRALKPTDGAVVSYSNSGTRGTCIFTTP